MALHNRKRPSDDVLLGYVENNTQYQVIADRFGVSWHTVSGWMHGLRRKYGRNLAGGMTAEQVTWIMGKSDNRIVQRWIKAGWLPALGRPQGAYLIYAEWLAEFIRCEAGWIDWEVAGMRDRAWQEYAAPIREGKDYLTLNEVGKLKGYSGKYLRQLVIIGTLEAERQGRWWAIRRDRIPEQIQRPRMNRHRYTPEQIEIIRFWNGRRSAPWIAGRIGLQTQGGVGHVMRQLREASAAT